MKVARDTCPWLQIVSLLTRPWIACAMLVVAALVLNPTTVLADEWDDAYCGIYSVYAAAGVHGIDARFEELLDPRFVSRRDGSTAEDLLAAASHLGLPARLHQGLTRFDLVQPSILHGEINSLSTDVAMLRAATVASPAGLAHYVLTVETEVLRGDGDFAAHFSGKRRSEVTLAWDGTGLVITDDTTLPGDRLTRAVFSSVGNEGIEFRDSVQPRVIATADAAATEQRIDAWMLIYGRYLLMRPDAIEAQPLWISAGNADDLAVRKNPDGASFTWTDATTGARLTADVVVKDERPHLGRLEIETSSDADAGRTSETFVYDDWEVIGENVLPRVVTGSMRVTDDQGRIVEHRLSMTAEFLDAAPDLEELSRQARLSIPDGTPVARWTRERGGVREEFRGGAVVPLMDASVIGGLDEAVGSLGHVSDQRSWAPLVVVVAIILLVGLLLLVAIRYRQHSRGIARGSES